MNRFFVRYLLLTGALFLVSCGGSGIGCSGCASSCGGNPNYKFTGSVAKDSVKVRVTQNGVDFLTQRLKPIIENLLKQSGQSLACGSGGIAFPTQTLGNGPKVNGQPVPPSGSNCGIKVSGLIPKAACTGGTPSSTWFYGALKSSSLCGALNTNSIKIKLNEADNSVNVTFDIPEVRVRSQSPDIGFCYKGKVSLIPGQICAGAKASLKQVQMILTKLGVDMKMKFSTDPNTGKVGLKVDTVKISSSTKFTVKLDGCNNITIPVNIPVINRSTSIKLGGGLCSFALNGIEGIINGTQFLQPLIFNLLGGVIKDQFKNVDLLAEAKVEMELPLSKTLGGLGLPLSSLQQSTPLGLLIKPGQALGVANGGLNMGMDSGFEATKNNPCVPARPQPQTQPGPPPALSGAFHFGAALSRAATNRALWAAYHTGVLCIKIKSEELGSQLGGFKLNAEVLSLLAPNLTKVVPKDAPLMIVIQPTQPPDSSFGTGKKVGGKTDSTIKLRIPDFGVSFYTMAHDRYVRIFKMIMDVNLGVSLVVSPQNELEVAVDADAIELKNARATAAYLVKISDPNSLLKLIVNLLTQTLGSNGLSIPVDISPQLSKALGVPISIKINGVGKDGAAGDWLSLKMTMSDKASPLLPTPRTIASLHKPAGLYRVENSRIIPTGEVLVDVPEFLGPYELEYQYRIGVGPWSTFHEATNGVLRVRSHILKVLGKHKVYIRGRIKGEYRTREEQPAVVEVLFDPVAPKASVKPHGDHLQIVAHDGVTPMQQLRYSYQLNGKWVAANGSRITLPASLKDAESVALRVRDNAGNTRIIHWSPAQQRVLGSQSTINGPHQRSTAFGCTTSPTPADGSLWLALILLLGLGTIRRRI